MICPVSGGFQEGMLMVQVGVGNRYMWIVHGCTWWYRMIPPLDNLSGVEKCKKASSGEICSLRMSTLFDFFGLTAFGDFGRKLIETIDWKISKLLEASYGFHDSWRFTLFHVCFFLCSTVVLSLWVGQPWWKWKSESPPLPPPPDPPKHCGMPDCFLAGIVDGWFGCESWTWAVRIC